MTDLGSLIGGAPTPAPAPEQAQAPGIKQQWLNFLRKLKTDANMQQALLNFGAYVSAPNPGGTVHAVNAALAQSVGGYHDAVRTQAAQARAEAREDQKLTADLAASAASTDRTRGLMEGDAASADLARAQAERTQRLAGNDAADAELTRVRTEAAKHGMTMDEARLKLQEAQLELQRLGGPGSGAAPAAKVQVMREMAQAMLALGQVQSLEEGILKAVELENTPPPGKVAADLAINQGFLLGDNLNSTIDATLAAVQRASQGTRAPASTPSASAVQAVPLEKLQALDLAYSQKFGVPPLPQAKLLELQNNPVLIQEMLTRLQSGD